MNALLSNAKGRSFKQTPSGYTRILGNVELGNLISKLQGTVISAGNELEDIIWSKVKQIDNLDKYLNLDIYPKGVFIARKEQIKKSFIAQKTFEPDFIAFQRDKNNNHACYVIEVKDGDQFDTKKSTGEREHLHNYMNFIAREIIRFTVNPIVCSFNAISKEQVVAGFKNKITKEEAYTGKELCELLNINFDAIVKQREADQKENMNNFVKSIVGIEEARTLIIKELKNYI